jgi:hypothetical protein
MIACIMENGCDRTYEMLKPTVFIFTDGVTETCDVFLTEEDSFSKTLAFTHESSQCQNPE